VLGESDYPPPQDSGGEHSSAHSFLKRPTARWSFFPRDSRALASRRACIASERLDHIVGCSIKIMDVCHIRNTMCVSKAGDRTSVGDEADPSGDGIFGRMVANPYLIVVRRLPRDNFHMGNATEKARSAARAPTRAGDRFIDNGFWVAVRAVGVVSGVAFTSILLAFNSGINFV